ncbi:MAG: M15 family metallopeptidase [Oscillospiraceae bacterium]|nr:M15 family metallopeptidase [Oscillospiraceae bacterium]
MSQRFILLVNILMGALFFGCAYFMSVYFDFASEQSVSEPGGFGHEFALYLINADNPLPENLEIQTAKVQGDFELDVRCAEYAVEMLKAAENDGISLVVCSAYRTPELQQRLFERSIENFISKGYTPSEARHLTALEIALPYQSEHNSGLAMDIVSQGWFLRHGDVTPDFEYTKEFKWLSENSWKYGFILRYPQGKTHLTGITYEPWHYRFVGLQKAEQVYCSNLTLEEYIEQLTIDS